MNKIEAVKDEISKVIKDGIEIIQFLQMKVQEKEKKVDFHSRYQKWYTKAIAVVAFLAPDRINDFNKYYKIDAKRKSLGYGTYVIEDYLMGVAPGAYTLRDFDTKAESLKNFYNQWTILISIKDRSNSILQNLQSELLFELYDNEISTAEKLIKVNPRAAGSLAGVILESHLQKIASSHQVVISKKNPTISDMNDPLKQAGIYGTPEWRKLSYLADIRNICSHKKDTEPTKEQVGELVEGVKWALKSIN